MLARSRIKEKVLSIRLLGLTKPIMHRTLNESQFVTKISDNERADINKKNYKKMKIIKIIMLSFMITLV